MSKPLDRFMLHDAPLDEGTILLEASAGTGKTYTITGVLLRMLLEGVIDHVEEALVVTFTVAAADELKNRLRSGIRRALATCEGHRDRDQFFQDLARHGAGGAKRLRRALDEFDRAAVMTIHGFCMHTLKESAFESDQPFDLDFEVDERPILETAAADALRDARTHDSPIFGALMQHARLTPTKLASLYEAWRLYPDSKTQPEKPQLDVHLSNLGAAVHAAASQWDDDANNALLELKWKTDKEPGRGDLTRYLREQVTQMQQRPEFALTFLNSISHAQLQHSISSKQEELLSHPFFARCGDVHARLTLTLDHLHVELLDRLDRRAGAIKRDQAVLTFDDMLEATHDAILAPGSRDGLVAKLNERYRVALIDEFQDTDARQYEILANAFAHRPLFLVGDPKQSIYGFRGADLRTYLAAAGDALTKKSLDKNFRSSKQVVRAINQLFGRNRAFVDPGITMQPAKADADDHNLQLKDPAGGAALRWRTLPFQQGKGGKPKHLAAPLSRQHIAADVAREIRRLITGGVYLQDKGKPERAIRPGHIAVLTRTNKESETIQEHLRRVGVVAVISKAGDVFETQEMDELERLLLAILRPYDSLRARAALTTRLWGFDAPALAALDDDELALETELSRLEQWRQAWIHRGFVAMKQQLLQDLHVEERMLAHSGGERSLTNLQQLCELLLEAEHERRLSPEGLLSWLQRQRAKDERVDARRRELRLESDEDAVQILTIHGSKGLEYEVVFCPFLWTSKRAKTQNVSVPDDVDDAEVSSRSFHFRLQPSGTAWLRAETDRLAEDVRLAYVALTRAKRRAYLYWGPIGRTSGYNWSALAWLLDPNPSNDKPGWQSSWGTSYHDGAASMYDDLEKLAADSEGVIAVDSIEPGAGRDEDRAAPPTRHAVPAGRRRPLPRRDPLTIHSFSSMVAGGEPGSNARDVRDPSQPKPEAGDGIFAFARGANAGQCLHTILEHVDLADLESGAAQAVVERSLTAHGLAETAAHHAAIDPAATVLQNIKDLALATAHPEGPTIAAICREPRLVEWKFTLPIGLPATDALASVFELHGGDVARGYAPRLRALRPRALRGYLTGFADLIALHEGRYWVVDWKSNYLGADVDDYEAAALRDAMNHHDYVLQYHLYVLAWHRHLTTRLSDYDYDEHFGGVCYAFLRGAQPNHHSGMFYDRPPRALIDAMDQWAEEDA